MGLFKKLKKKWNDWYYHDIDDDDEAFDWEEDEQQPRDDSFYADKDQRAVYVLGELEKMAEAADKLEECQAEYDAVTSLLVDIEEIEALPKHQRLDIMDVAQKIESLERQRHNIFAKTGRLSDADINILERYEEDIPAGINKIREAEEYRRLIKSDLHKLDRERQATHQRKKDLTMLIANSRGIAIICAVAMIVCLIGLALLNFVYDMDVSLGYLIIAGAGAITLTVIYVKYVSANQELGNISKVINKLIALHNTVKIRYVNNTNLLQYMYMKYDVESSDELERKWNVFVEEEKARRLDEKLKADLEYYYDKLTGLLKTGKIKDPDIWTHQAKALYDNREMVEVRHALIGRRQKLREQMEYNENLATSSRDTIKDLGRRYPQYSAEIAGMVKNFNGL